MLSKYGILIASAASLLALIGCNSTDNQNVIAPVNTAVEATVNGSPITASRVDLMAKQKAEHGQSGNAELRKGIIDQLAMQLILSQEAIKAGLDKSPEVADQIALAQQSLLAKAFVQDYLNSHPVTDDMLKAEYEKVKGQMAGVEYRARQILVENEADAKDIIAKLKKNPKAFESLAKEKSKDLGSGSKGGDLGWFDSRSMNPEVEAVIKRLAKGQIADEPVKSPNGYHVILLEDSRQKQPPTLEQTKSVLQQRVRQQNLKKMLDALKANAKIEIVQVVTPATPSDKKN
jgi:peptidyl-prolyl cis-trans isomerase C